MQWFRFYDEVLDDPKVQQLPADLFKTWVNLLCLAARNGGILPDRTAIAFALRLPAKTTEAKVRALIDAGLLDETAEGEMQPHNWDRRQFKSDNVTGRVRKHRTEQARNVSQTVPGNVSGAAPKSLHVTPPEQSRKNQPNRTKNLSQVNGASGERAVGDPPDANQPAVRG